MQINECPDYIIYENGDVFSKNRTIMKSDGSKHFYKSKKMSPWKGGDGYFRISVQVNKKQKHFFVHRLIAIAYIPNPTNLPFINHIDCNRVNNNIDNLEWCSNMHNTQSINTSKRFGNVYKSRNKFRATYTSNGIRYGKTFDTIEEGENWLVEEKLKLIKS
tara:strand:+ start:41 stop:523 length:483 start_codon:yes stop_codon:yes gene_type:complete